MQGSFGVDLSLGTQVRKFALVDIEMRGGFAGPEKTGHPLLLLGQRCLQPLVGLHIFRKHDLVRIALEGVRVVFFH